MWSLKIPIVHNFFAVPKTFQFISSLKIVANFVAMLFLAAANVNNVLGCGDLVIRVILFI